MIFEFTISVKRTTFSVKPTHGKTAKNNLNLLAIIMALQLKILKINIKKLTQSN